MPNGNFKSGYSPFFSNIFAPVQKRNLDYPAMRASLGGCPMTRLKARLNDASES